MLEEESTRAGDDVAFRETLTDALRAVDSAGIPYLLMGGVGSARIGRPRWTHDIDLFVTPDNAKPALRALKAAGFSTEETDPVWLFKAWKRDVLVDVIFKSSGDIYLDEEMVERGSPQQFDGCAGRVMAPEDLIVIKAVTADEHVVRHWYDALGLLSTCDIDWEYLVRRGRRHGLRRLLSLLIYAESNDIWVPESAVRELFDAVHGGGRSEAAPHG